jgi:hypothetical protein
VIVPIEKPGTPQELVHFGVKGMRWGVRKSEESSSNTPKTPMSTKKKVAIGVGVAATVVVGAAVTAYILKNRGSNPISYSENVRTRKSSIVGKLLKQHGWKRAPTPDYRYRNQLAKEITARNREEYQAEVARRVQSAFLQSVKPELRPSYTPGPTREEMRRIMEAKPHMHY